MTGHHTEATPRPWRADTAATPRHRRWVWLPAKGINFTCGADDALLIVEAVNTYDAYRDLEAAAREYVAEKNLDRRTLDAIRAALARLDQDRGDTT